MLQRPLAIFALFTVSTLSACSGGGTANIPSAHTPNAQAPTNGLVPAADAVAMPENSPPGTLQLAPISPASAKDAKLLSFVPTAAPSGSVLFQDTFSANVYNQFATAYGSWAPCQRVSQQLCATGVSSNEVLAGVASWKDYTASTRVIIDAVNPMRNGVDLVYRATDRSHFYELELVREADGSKQWEIWRNTAGSWTNLARGLVDFTSGVEYGLRVQVIGSHFVASLSRDGGATYDILGSADDTSYAAGKIGLRAWGSMQAAFDQVLITGENGATAAPSTAPSSSPSGAAPPPSGLAIPAMTPIPAGAPADTAFTIPAPSQVIPESTPAPLCIAGTQYGFAVGDDFTQETQAQFQRYTTQWEINQYQYGGAKTNWVWSDQYSGIGRRNDFGAGDTYMVHIDDANPSRSFPGPWVNSVQPRPGAQIIGTPPNAYLDIRAVAIPAQYLSDPNNNGAHWLSGGLQSNKFTFGYTEATVQMTANDGAWPALWDLQVPGGGGYDGTGTSPSNYWEIDTFEKFGNTLGLDGIQMTTDSGRATAQFVRPQTPGSTTSYHSYGQLWVPPLLGNPAYIVFYVDRKPVSYYLAPTGVGNMNMNVNLQMGTPGSFVGTPDKTQIADMKLKNYFTWQPTGASCGGTVQNTIPTPAPSAPPVAAPPVASNVVPKLVPYSSPLEILTNTQTFSLPSMPANGDLLIAQGISGFAVCPGGFTTTGAGDGYLCTGIVGQNGLAAATRYLIGGAGFDIGALVDIHNVTSYTINPDTSTGWHSEANPVLTKSQAVPGPNRLALAFGYAITDQPRYLTSVNYTSNLPFNTLYHSEGTTSFGRGMAMLETKVDPYGAAGNAVSFTGSYAWAGAPSTNGNSLFPAIITVLVR